MQLLRKTTETFEAEEGLLGLGLGQGRVGDGEGEGEGEGEGDGVMRPRRGRTHDMRVSRREYGEREAGKHVQTGTAGGDSEWVSCFCSSIQFSTTRFPLNSSIVPYNGHIFRGQEATSFPSSLFPNYLWTQHTIFDGLIFKILILILRTNKR